MNKPKCGKPFEFDVLLVKLIIKGWDKDVAHMSIGQQDKSWTPIYRTPIYTPVYRSPWIN